MIKKDLFSRSLLHAICGRGKTFGCKFFKIFTNFVSVSFRFVVSHCRRSDVDADQDNHADVYDRLPNVPANIRRVGNRNSWDTMSTGPVWRLSFFLTTKLNIRLVGCSSSSKLSLSCYILI